MRPYLRPSRYSKYPGSQAQWKRGSIVAGVADFVHAVHGRQPATVDPWDGCYAIELVEAAYRSFNDGGVIVVP